MLELNQVVLGSIHKTKKIDEYPSQRIIDFVYSEYADDYRLGKEKGLIV